MASDQAVLSEAAGTIRRLLLGGQIAHVVHAAAELGLADHLNDKPLDVQSLAKATATHAPSLARLLRALAAIGIVHETDDHHYTLTPLGAALQTDAPGSMRARARLHHDEMIERPWHALPHAVRSGEIAFQHVFGIDLFAYMATHPESSEKFDQAQREVSQGVNASLASCYPFGIFKWIVDVGGGIGSLLIPILERNPTLRGTVFEFPHVAVRAREQIAACGLAARCDVAEGDALAEVPPGADAYVLKSVIHGHEDDKAVTILRNCRTAMPPHGKVILIERLLPEHIDPGDEQAGASFIMDISMMVLPGGCERTERAYRDVLAKAELGLHRTIPTAGPTWILEAFPL